MIDPHGVLIDNFAGEVLAAYKKNYGDSDNLSNDANMGEVLSWLSRMALQLISRSDSLYHDVEHTILAVSVSHALLEGKHTMEGGVSPRDWMRVILATLCHDIGFAGSCCLNDDDHEVATGNSENPRVSRADFPTNASLMPFHVDRSQLFVRERFSKRLMFDMTDEDIEVICEYIEMTRFPVPQEPLYQQTKGFGALVRTADLIGQLSDPRYLQKIPALYYEFKEMGADENFGYKDPRDLTRKYPEFFRNVVYPLIKDSLPYLELTATGRQWVANLYANLMRVETTRW